MEWPQRAVRPSSPLEEEEEGPSIPAMLKGKGLSPCVPSPPFALFVL